ncbi:MAG: hypothetical protein LBE01_04450, partial [Deltaproteobacteria bacterium]|nr:hypothetical protein [Deltaproteobacteria bacterium]
SPTADPAQDLAKASVAEASPAADPAQDVAKASVAEASPAADLAQDLAYGPAGVGPASPYERLSEAQPVSQDLGEPKRPPSPSGHGPA